jgi:tRNA G18 (ribose-2'-O)-methylase SpoU
MTEDAINILDFDHPQRCIYLLGTEDTGLSAEALERCDHIIKLPGARSMNVSVAGALVLYDRYFKNKCHAKKGLISLP